MSTPSPNLEEQARALAENAQWREAARLLTQAAREEPDNVRRWLQIVEWQREGGDARAAARTLRDALRLNRAPQRASASKNRNLIALWEALAETLLEDQRWDECIAACRSLLDLAPRHHWAREMLATALLHSDRIADAETVMRELLAISPLDPLHRLRLATLLQLQQRHEEAMRELQYVVESQPPGPLHGEALEAIETLDKMQTQQILARAAEQWHFRTQLENDLEEALEEAGFRLSDSGRETLRYIIATGGESDDDFHPPVH